MRLAPSLEGLMRQQALASRNRFESERNHPTLINRHSLPDGRQISVKGLTGQDFRRASVAGTETIPRIESLGRKSEPFNLSITEEFRSKENERFQLIFDQFFKPELDRGALNQTLLLPPVLIVRQYEKRLYKNLCAFVVSCLSIEQGVNKSLMKLTQTALSYLRSIEECESSRVCKGFVNKIDNYLAILLFRHPGTDDELGTGKLEFPLSKTIGRSKSNGVSYVVTEDLGATGSSLTSDSQQLGTMRPPLIHNPNLHYHSKKANLNLGVQIFIVLLGALVLLGIWTLLYPESTASAHYRYGVQLTNRIKTRFSVDRSIANLALNIPKEVIDDFTKNSRFSLVEPHLVVMTSSIPTAGASWIFLPDSGAFAVAIRHRTDSNIFLIERTRFGSQCNTFNVSSSGHRIKSAVNVTVICPSLLGMNTTIVNWSSPTSIDETPLTYGLSQIRLASSSKRPVVIGIHFSRELVNAVFDNVLLSKPQDMIVLRDLFSGDIISASGSIINQSSSTFKTVFSSAKFDFANTTANLTVAVSIPPPLSNLQFSSVLSLGICSGVFLIISAVWMRPVTKKDNLAKPTSVIPAIVEENPGNVLRGSQSVLLVHCFAILCISGLLLLYLSSDKLLQNVSDDIWLQLGRTLQEKLRLLPAVARLVSSTAVLQLTDVPFTAKTFSSRASAVTQDALTRIVQMPLGVALASSIGVAIKGSSQSIGSNIYGFHLPNISNPDPKTFETIKTDKELDWSQSDWFQNSTSVGMFGSIRHLLSGDDAVPFGKNFNCTGLGKCVVLIDFSREILNSFLSNYVSLAGISSISLRLYDTPALDFLGSTMSSEAGSSISVSEPSNVISRTPIFDRDSLSLNIPYLDDQTSWFTKAIVSLHEVCGSISEINLTAWIVFTGIVTILIFLIYATTWNTDARRQRSTWFGVKIAEAIIALAKERPSKSALSHHLHNIRSRIISASGQSWRRKRNLRSGDLGDYDQPLDFDEIQKHVSERAVRHVRDALHNRNILTLCELESRENPTAVQIYKLVSHNLSRTILFIVAVIHIGLQMFEPQTQLELQENGTDLWIILTEGFCLLFEITYILFHFGLKYHLMAMENVLSEVDNSLAIDVMTVIVLALTCLDWILTMAVRFSFEFACPLRPWIFLLFFADLRRGLSLFLRAIARAFDVILLWMSIIFIFALFGVLLFRTNLNAGTNTSSFGNIRDALITCFVFAATADNFSDLIYNASQTNALFMLFFVVLWMIGMFCILAMVVGCFQHEFMHQQEKNVQQKTVITRTGMIAAFILIDVDQSGGISVEEFRDFISGCANHDAAATRRAFLKMFRNIDTNGDGQMDIYEFVMGIEDLSLNRLFIGRRHPAIDTKWKQWMREKVFHSQSEWWRKLIEILLLIELTAACTYGVSNDVSTIDWICHGMLLFFTVEMLAKMFVYGPTEMLIHGRYDGSMFERRFDTVVVFGAAISYYATRFCNQPDQGILPKSNEDSLRILQLLPVLRILSQVKIIRHVITTFLRSAREFLNLFCLLLVIIDIYANIGVFLFAGLWSDPTNPDANFNTHSNAFIALVQCMVQQDWRTIMYHAISTYGWSAALYFISFIFCVSILFTNLFLGIILTQFSKIVEHKREMKAALQKPELNQSQRWLFDV